MNLRFLFLVTYWGMAMNRRDFVKMLGFGPVLGIFGFKKDVTCSEPVGLSNKEIEDFYRPNPNFRPPDDLFDDIQFISTEPMPERVHGITKEFAKNHIVAMVPDHSSMRAGCMKMETIWLKRL